MVAGVDPWVTWSTGPCKVELSRDVWRSTTRPHVTTLPAPRDVNPSGALPGTSPGTIQEPFRDSSRESAAGADAVAPKTGLADHGSRPCTKKEIICHWSLKFLCMIMQSCIQVY